MIIKGNKLYVIISLFVALMIAGCGGGGSGETLEAHDVTLSNGFESEVPMPKKASIQMDEKQDGIHIIMFSPGMNFTKSEQFFSDRLSSNGWTLTEENLTEKAEGEMNSSWYAEKEGVIVYVGIGAFGDKSTTNIVGTMSIE